MMHYRRFGKTQLQMPVLSCGGMRYQQAWEDLEPSEIKADGQANLEATIRRSLEVGINHIETARGYGSSEWQLGRILPNLPRDEMIVQTKVGPEPTAAGFHKTFDFSMKCLELDHVDLLGVHGINNVERLEHTLGPTMEACQQILDEGRARHLGFSTHGPPDVVRAAIESNCFSYVNLHWYYLDQLNLPAIEAARERDMGVFIISPSDKGGKLYEPPQKLVDLCSPLTPMAFNDLFCLSMADVHTISIGAAKPSDFDAHLAAMPHLDNAEAVIRPIISRIEAEFAQVLGADWMAGWNVGVPEVVDTPGEVNLYHTLRLYNCVKALDMTDYGHMRYNLLGNADHWFPGNKVDRMQWDKLADAVKQSPVADRIPDVLHEAHELMNAGDLKRLSQS
jgi:predicted aldo/keto reductase-like oxidoreductase